MRWTNWIAAAAFVLCAGAGSAQAPPAKLALVIGNADYNGDGRIDPSEAGAAASEAAGYVPDLRNPLNDAADIRDALQGIGFRVDFVQNADGAQMSTALASFGAKVAAAPDDVQVVIYYAGHAMQVDGANFLIPVKAQLPGLDYAAMPSGQVQTVLRRVAVSTTEITDQFRVLRAPGVNVLILDSCRNNPWEGRVRGIGRGVGATRGLAEIAAPPRTVIAFSTAPGQTAADGSGRNSPFAAALKEGIGKPGTVLQVLDGVGGAVQTSTNGRQTPWFQSASVGQSCLARCGADAAELADFQNVLANGLMEDALAFLARYPNGAYTAQVRALTAAEPVHRYRYSHSEPVEDTSPPQELTGARPFLLFFYRNDYSIIPSSLPLVEEMKQQCHGARQARVTGYDDTYLIPKRSSELTLKRAKLVAEFLTEMGIPAEGIQLVAAGQNDPLTPTGPAQLQAENRRVLVEIVC